MLEDVLLLAMREAECTHSCRAFLITAGGIVLLPSVSRRKWFLLFRLDGQEVVLI